MQLDDFLMVTSAINDESRVRILAFLDKHAQETMLCVCDLQESFDFIQSRLSRHLKILKNAGFLIVERKGVWAYYSISKDLGHLQSDILCHIRSLNLPLPRLQRYKSVCNAKTN